VEIDSSSGILSTCCNIVETMSDSPHEARVSPSTVHAPDLGKAERVGIESVAQKVS
jgi:hypothetical protein